MKKKKQTRVVNNRTMRNVKEGDRIYRRMADAMLSADLSVGGTVAMNYALSKLIANYKLAMMKMDVDVSKYLDGMTQWWVEHFEAEANDDDQLAFDGFVYTVQRLAENI